MINQFKGHKYSEIENALYTYSARLIRVLAAMEKKAIEINPEEIDIKSSHNANSVMKMYEEFLDIVRRNTLYHQTLFLSEDLKIILVKDNDEIVGMVNFVDYEYLTKRIKFSDDEISSLLLSNLIKGENEYQGIPVIKHLWNTKEDAKIFIMAFTSVIKSYFEAKTTNYDISIPDVRKEHVKCMKMLEAEQNKFVKTLNEETI